MAVDTTSTLSGLDALELAAKGGGRSRGARVWAATWPKLLALTIVVAAWQVVTWTGWRPEFVLPPPLPVAEELARAAGTPEFWLAVITTMRRAVVGFAVAAGIGFVLGIAVARSRVLRSAIGSLITALQTMPSIAWFPLAILLYQLSENAIMFVVVLGAAPSVANGVITGVDYVPPLLLQAGRNIGARGVALYRHVIAPASLPSIVAGLKQGWAFSWRSLMAGELLVIIPGAAGLGVQMQFARDFNDSAGLMAYMIVILVIGIVVDTVFGSADRAIRRRWGVTD